MSNCCSLADCAVKNRYKFHYILKSATTSIFDSTALIISNTSGGTLV